jgi:hypothetical protein
VGSQIHPPPGDPAFPHGQGFMAATSWNWAGNRARAMARVISTYPVSMGSLRLSRAPRCTWGSSSRKRTPRWASVISPGRMGTPPPTSDGTDAEWCGARKGGRQRGAPVSGRSPAAEWITVTEIRSSSVRSARIPGSARARRVFPTPGGPVRRIPCSPTAAISRARRARN